MDGGGGLKLNLAMRSSLVNERVTTPAAGAAQSITAAQLIAYHLHA